MEIVFFLPIHTPNQVQIVLTNVCIHLILEAYSRKHKVGEKIMAWVFVIGVCSKVKAQGKALQSGSEKQLVSLPIVHEI